MTSAGADCLIEVQASAAGHYNSQNLYPIDRQLYIAGQDPTLSGGEMRNWFLFFVPTLSRPLVRAELRVFAGGVETADGSERFELHQVTTPFGALLNYTGDPMATFQDLGDGPLFGSQVITTNDAAQPYRLGALISVPFTPAGLDALTAAQGALIVGGAVATLDADMSTGETIFRGLQLAQAPVELLLFLSDPGPPQITVLSDPITTLAGPRISLATAVCGAAPLSFQWLKDNVPILGATNETLEIPSCLPADSGFYRLRASNPLGFVSAPPIRVDVTALTLVQEPESRTVYEPQAVSLSVGVQSELPLQYQWRKDGLILLSAPNSSFLLLSPSTAADSGRYDVIVSNAAGAVTSAVATVTVLLRAPDASSPLPSQDVAVGLPLFMYAAATGSEPLIVQWYKDGQAIPDAVGTYYFQLPTTTFADAGDYYYVASNPVGSATSAVARVSIVGLRVTSGPFVNNALLSNYTTLVIQVDSSARAFYQWYFNGLPVLGGTNLALEFPALDPSQAGDYFVTVSNIYTVVTSEVATVTVVTQAPVASVFINNSSGSSRAFLGDQVKLAANVYAGPPASLQWFHDGLLVPGWTSNLIWIPKATSTDGGSYIVTAANSLGSVTSAPVSLEVVAAAPFFVVVPQPTNQVAGSVVSMRAYALGGPRPTYQWRHNGISLPGATNAILTLPGARVQDAGLYEVIARNDLGEDRFSTSLEIRASTGLDEWNWSLPHPQGNRLHKVAWGNGRYTAVGKSGNIITSLDGLNWSNVIVEADCDFYSVASGNGRLVTAGLMTSRSILKTNLPNGDFYPTEFTGIVLTSPDGLSWTAGQVPENDSLGEIAFGAGRFVAASYFRSVFAYVSTDGVHWTPILAPDRKAYRVVWSNGRFVVSTSDRLYSSANGTDWEIALARPYVYFDLLAADASGFTAVSTVGSVFTSPDARTWTERGVVGRYLTSVTAGGGRWVGTPNYPVGGLVVSEDGYAWTLVDTGTRQEIESVVYADSRFLAVGEAGTITTSSDGTSWSPSQVPNLTDYYAITHGESMVVAAGDDGVILTTTDGGSWTRRTTPTTRNLHAAHYANGLFVAGGRRGTLLTSPDSVSWTSRASGIANYVERISWADGLWVGVGEHGDLTTSLNGVNWTGRSTGSPYSDHEGVAFGAGRWVAVGGYFKDPQYENGAITTIYTSPNGIAWTLAPLNAGKRLRDVVFASGKFVAVGNDGLVATSSNAVSWSSYYLGYENFRRIAYANGRFVVVGNNGSIFSSLTPDQPDAWTNHRSRSSLNLHDLSAAPDGTIFAVGNNGMILRSGFTLPRFLNVQPVPTGFRLDLDPGLVAGILRLESSTNMATWSTAQTGLSNSVIVPRLGPMEAFRLVAP